MSRQELKEEEKFFTEKYMKYKYNHNPDFKETKLDIPDCYFKFKDKHYAVEVTRYFQQNSEKKHIENVNNIQKILEKDDFVMQFHKRLGKKKSDTISIAFYDVEELKSTIIENIKVIKEISIGNNYYFNEKGEDVNDVICIGSSQDKMNITDFINYAEKDILNEEHIELEIKTKNKYDVSVIFKYCKYHYYGESLYNKKVIPFYCWTENTEELYNNIIEAIIYKNNKLIDEYILKFKKSNIHYDYYNLVLYNEGIPADLDEQKLYNKILKIENLVYNEIAIFLWKKIMIINKSGFEVYKYDRN